MLQVPHTVPATVMVRPPVKRSTKAKPSQFAVNAPDFKRQRSNAFKKAYEEAAKLKLPKLRAAWDVVTDVAMARQRKYATEARLRGHSIVEIEATLKVFLKRTRVAHKKLRVLEQASGGRLLPPTVSCRFEDHGVTSSFPSDIKYFFGKRIKERVRAKSWASADYLCRKQLHLLQELKEQAEAWLTESKESGTFDVIAEVKAIKSAVNKLTWVVAYGGPIKTSAEAAAAAGILRDLANFEITGGGLNVNQHVARAISSKLAKFHSKSAR